MPEPDLFSDQAKERPDASSPTGRKIVYEDDPEPKGETLPDGRSTKTGPRVMDMGVEELCARSVMVISIHEGSRTATFVTTSKRLTSHAV